MYVDEIFTVTRWSGNVWLGPGILVDQNIAVRDLFFVRVLRTWVPLMQRTSGLHSNQKITSRKPRHSIQVIIRARNLTVKKIISLPFQFQEDLLVKLWQLLVKTGECRRLLLQRRVRYKRRGGLHAQARAIASCEQCLRTKICRDFSFTLSSSDDTRSTHSTHRQCPASGTKYPACHRLHHFPQVLESRNKTLPSQSQDNRTQQIDLLAMQALIIPRTTSIPQVPVSVHTASRNT